MKNPAVKRLKEARIIAVYNQKGGCAKTMTSMQLSGVLGSMGYRVLVLDMDKQRTAAVWCGQAAMMDRTFPATVIEFTAYKGQAFVREIEKHAQNYDFIVIDCPPAVDSREPWHALLVADIGLIPTTPLGDNVWAATEAFELGRQAREENERLALYVLPSRVGRGTIYEVFADQLKTSVEEFGIEMLPFQFSALNAYPTSQVLGGTVLDVDSKGKAADEVRALADWVVSRA